MPLVALATVLAAMTPAAAPASAARDAHPCVAAGERVVARSADTIVTVRRRVTGEGVLDTPDTESVWRACRRRTGERTELERGFGRWKASRSASAFALAGSHVLYLLSDGDVYGSIDAVLLRDLDSGSSTELAASELGFDHLTLAPGGAAAWTRTTSGRFALRLETRGSTGRPRVLARFRDPRHLTGLRFAPGRTVLRWRDRGRARSARITAP